MRTNLVEQLRLARMAGVPLVAVSTADECSTVASIAAALNGDGTPIVAWDIVSGTVEVNEAGREVAAMTGVGEADVTVGSTGCPMFLKLAKEFPGAADDGPGGTIAFVRNADQYLKPDGTPAVLQGVLNLRDPYKADGRMLVLLSPGPMTLPAALRGHVVVLDDPLPDAAQLREMIAGLDVGASQDCPGRPTMDEATLGRAVEAVRGVHMFAAETAVSMSLREDGIDLDQLWRLKKSQLNQIQGLTVDECEETFDDVGGIEQVKQMGRDINEGPEPPAVYVQIEEIGKVFAAAQTDSSGTSQDASQVLLTAMEDNGWTGIVAYGPAGTGKTFFSRVIARTYGALALRLDVNGTKDRWVGSSGQNIRAAIAAVKAIGGRRVFFVGTSNEMDTLSPELRRRFSMGVYYFDMPDEAERSSIWRLCRAKAGIPEGQAQPDDRLYSAANIRDVCFVARKTGKTLVEAAQYVLPAGVIGKEQITKSRANADGRYLSASRPGVYRMPREDAAPKGRAVRVAKGMAN